MNKGRPQQLASWPRALKPGTFYYLLNTLLKIFFFLRKKFEVTNRGPKEVSA